MQLPEAEARLSDADDDRVILTAGDLPLTVHEYLKTRLVEIVAHTDDLAASVGIAPPTVTDEAGAAVIATLAELARLRHGTTAVLRSLARRERATPPIHTL